MKRLRFIVVVLLASAAPVHAIESHPCDEAQYKSAGGAEYIPGVDVSGHAVTPADLTSQNNQNAHILDNSSVDLELPLSGYTDIAPYNADLSDSHVNAGSIWLNSTDAEMNGQKPASDDGCPSESEPVPQPKEGEESGS